MMDDDLEMVKRDQLALSQLRTVYDGLFCVLNHEHRRHFFEALVNLQTNADARNRKARKEAEK